MIYGLWLRVSRLAGYVVKVAEYHQARYLASVVAQHPEVVLATWEPGHVVALTTRGYDMDLDMSVRLLFIRECRGAHVDLNLYGVDDPFGRSCYEEVRARGQYALNYYGGPG